MGDSLLAWNRSSGHSIANEVERLLGEPVLDRSVSGAQVMYALPITGAMGLHIRKQYRMGPWQWVILNGGGNDLWLGCGCHRCDYRLNSMLSPDGSAGHIAGTVAEMRQSGAKVIYIGYMRSPGRGSVIESCTDVGNDLDRRLHRMAERDPGVFFISNQDLVPFGDGSFHAFDRIHPSAKGSRAIAERIAQIIQRF